MNDATADKPRLCVTNTIFLLGTLAIAVVATPWYIWRQGLGWPEVLTFFLLWLAVGTSVTAGYHRLFSHKTYEAAWPVRLFFLVFGAAALENSVLNWAADHRVHHSHVDEEKDPYNITKGFWWAHIGWIFFDIERPKHTVVRDLTEDPLVVWQDRWYRTIGLGIAFGVPLLVGLLTGRVLGCLLIGGVLRVVVSHHGTFFINSLCHMVGTQPYSQEHSARDSSVMAVLAFGEGYHNYHHSFPFDYRNGVRSWHFDPAKWLIWALSKVGLARGLRRASDVQILKARIEVQFETARERMERVVADFRTTHESRLHEAYAGVQKAIHDFLTLQRRQKPAGEADPAGNVGEEALPVETRLGLTRRALENALREWKQALEHLHRLPVAAPA